jgi:hypothetical protein
METVPLFWDCNCPHQYVHPRAIAICKRCGARSEDQPDSRFTEVMCMLLGGEGIGDEEPTPPTPTGSE